MNKPRYLLLHEDGIMTVTAYLGNDIVNAFDTGLLEVVDMESRQYLKAIPVGGFQWEFIDEESDD